MQVFVARSCRFAGRGACAASLLMAALAATPARALDLRAATAVPGLRPDATGRVELSASSLPTFWTSDGATRSTRVDMIWLPPRQPSLGLALGLTTTDGSAFLPASGPTAGPAIDLGLHWRSGSTHRFNVSAWMRMPSTAQAASLQQDPQPDYGARFEMRMNAAHRNLFADHGILGLQLESGARIGVRRYAGHPMLYYRTSF